MAYAQFHEQIASKRRRFSDDGCGSIPPTLFALITTGDALFDAVLAGAEMQGDEVAMSGQLEDDVHQGDFDLMFSNTKEIYIGSLDSTSIQGDFGCFPF
jgi:hypothetical protein